MFKNIHVSCIHNSPKLEEVVHITVQKKYIVISPYERILHNLVGDSGWVSIDLEGARKEPCEMLEGLVICI